MWLIQAKVKNSNLFYRYITRFDRPYPTMAKILINEYDMDPKEKILVKHTRRYDLPKFKGFRSKFRKVFFGTVEEFDIFVLNYFKKRVWKKHENNRG